MPEASEKSGILKGDVCMTYGISEDKAADDVQLPLSFARHILVAHDMANSEGGKGKIHLLAQNFSRLVKQVGFGADRQGTDINLDYLDSILDDPGKSPELQLLEKLAEVRIKIVAVLKEIFGLSGLVLNTSTIRLLQHDKQKRDFVLGYLDWVMSHLTTMVRIGAKDESSIRSATVGTLPAKYRKGDIAVDNIPPFEFAYPHSQAAFALSFLRDDGIPIAPTGEKFRGEQHQVEILRELTAAIHRAISAEDRKEELNKYEEALRLGIDETDAERVRTEWLVDPNLMGASISFSGGQSKPVDPYYMLRNGDGDSGGKPSFQIPFYPSGTVRDNVFEERFRDSSTSGVMLAGKKFIYRELHPLLRRWLLPRLKDAGFSALLRSRMRGERFQLFVDWLESGQETSIIPRGDLMLLGKLLQGLAQEVENRVKMT